MVGVAFDKMEVKARVTFGLGRSSGDFIKQDFPARMSAAESVSKRVIRRNDVIKQSSESRRVPDDG